MTKIINKPELLAPAGDLERLKWAFRYGADAVYLGGDLFSLRANANNLSLEDINEGVKYAHNLNKKVYVTVNIVLHNEEIKKIKDYLIELDKIGVDAIIISDPAIIPIVKENTNLELHLSTQACTLNYEAVSFWKKQGVTRIVLGREVTKEEIIEIKKRVDIEIECFIHGAMCASYSGRCVLSNFLTARDSNRGGCSQICRWDFDLLDSNNNKLQGEKDFTFCTKDLSLLKYIPDMVDIGVNSFKIEGRMRSLYYVATVVDIYRRVIDEYCNNPTNYTYNKNYERVLRNCANRDSVTQFFNNVNDESCQYYNGREEVSNQDFLGIILDYDKKQNMAIVEQRNYFKKGDTVNIFGPSGFEKDLKIEKIYNENMEEVEIANHPKEILKIKADYFIPNNSMMRVKF